LGSALGLSGTVPGPLAQPRGDSGGGARERGARASPAPLAEPLVRRCARIFSITARSSMQAMIRSVPPQAAQR